LDRVVGFACRAEHAVGHRAQVVSVRLEIVHGYLSARHVVMTLTQDVDKR
jgi:hypothetical protein